MGRWKPFKAATPVHDEEKLQAIIKEHAGRNGMTEEDIRAVYAREQETEFFKNNIYQVSIRRGITVAEGWPSMAHLSIRRLDRSPIRDWRDMQRIKNELIGPHNEGVELFPDEDRVVDTANQYHLWVIEDTENKFPFGFATGLKVGTTAEETGIGQRPFEDI